MCESENAQAMPQSGWAAEKAAAGQAITEQRVMGGRLSGASCNTRAPQPTVRQHLQRNAEQALKQALFYTTRMNALPKSTLDMTLEEYHKSVNLHPPYDETDDPF